MNADWNRIVLLSLTMAGAVFGIVVNQMCG